MDMTNFTAWNEILQMEEAMGFVCMEALRFEYNLNKAQMEQKLLLKLNEFPLITVIERLV